MFTLHPFKQAEIDKKKADDLRKRTILEYNLKIEYMKFQSVIANINIESPKNGNQADRTQEQLLNDQIIEKIRQQQLLYENEQLKIQQNYLISKILKSGSSKFHYLKNEFPKYSLYVIIDEDYKDTLINDYYDKVKENKIELDKAQDKLTEIIKLVNISKIQEEKKSKDEQIKSKYFKEHKNKKKSDQFLLLNKNTIEIIKYLEQLISNFQNQMTQIKESKRISKKICYLFINEELLNINKIVKKIDQYFKSADEIEIIKNLKRKFQIISEEWDKARDKLKKSDEKISKETDEIELQKLERQNYILNNSIKHIKHKIAYFYVKLIIFCNDDSKENLNKLLYEYKNLKKQLDEFKNRRYNYIKNRVNDIILDLETKIEADYYNKNDNNLYKDILVSAKILIKGENNKKHSKSLMKVIIDRIKKNVDDKNDDEDDEDCFNTQISQNFIDHTAGIQGKIDYNEDNLKLYQFLKPDQYMEVIKILTDKKSIKVSESEQNHIVTDRCDSEIKSIDNMLNKLKELQDKEDEKKNKEDDSNKKQEDDSNKKQEDDSNKKQDDDSNKKKDDDSNKKKEDSNKKKEDSNKKKEDSNKKKDDSNKKKDDSNKKKDDSNKKKDDSNKKKDDDSNKKKDDDSNKIKVDDDNNASEIMISSNCSSTTQQISEIFDIDDIEGCPQINFEDYEIKELGLHGSSGSINVALDKTTNKEVAIKFYSHNISKEHMIRIVKISNTDIIGLAKTIGYHFALTNDEIEEYKNKIQNFDSYPHKGCIVMNLYKNTNLSDHNRAYLNSYGENNNIINPTIRSKIIFGVAAIMKKLHERQIVHRDLKISNILLDDNNDPVICDFDLSYSINDIKFEKNLSQSEDVQGTPYYVSPEKINADEDKTNTFASDVYSYAMILYFLFSTSIKFSDCDKFSLFQFYRKIVDGKRPVKPQNIPDHYWKLIQSCWDGNPYRRPTFSDITDILKDDKYALEEFGMKTDLDELHEYQRKLGEYQPKPSEDQGVLVFI